MWVYLKEVLDQLAFLMHDAIGHRCAYTKELNPNVFYKPYKFRASWQWQPDALQRCTCLPQMHQPLMIKGADGRVTGHKKHLKESAMYPLGLAQDLFAAWRSAPHHYQELTLGSVQKKNKEQKPHQKWMMGHGETLSRKPALHLPLVLGFWGAPSKAQSSAKWSTRSQTSWQWLFQRSDHVQLWQPVALGGTWSTMCRQWSMEASKEPASLKEPAMGHGQLSSCKGPSLCHVQLQGCPVQGAVATTLQVHGATWQLQHQRERSWS